MEKDDFDGHNMMVLFLLTIFYSYFDIIEFDKVS